VRNDRRFTTTDLRELHVAIMAAFEQAAVAARPRTVMPLQPVPETPWDPPLRTAMQDAGCVVYEEQLRASLLDAIAGSLVLYRLAGLA